VTAKTEKKKKNDGVLGLLKGSPALLAVLEDTRSRGGDRGLMRTTWKQPPRSPVPIPAGGRPPLVIAIVAPP
jgi:hypothetical protein